MKKWIVSVFAAGLLAAGPATDGLAENQAIINPAAESSMPQIAGRVTIPSDAPLHSALNGSSPASATTPPRSGVVILSPGGTTAGGPRNSSTPPLAPKFGLVISPQGSLSAAIVLQGAGTSAGREPGSRTAIVGPIRAPTLGTNQTR